MASFATLAELGAALESLTKRLEAVVECCVVLNDELWYWAQYRAKQLQKDSVSEYIFDLIRENKRKAK